MPVVGCSLLIYAAGMIWNDCADYAEDSKYRPQRPLPSGSISRRTAFAVAVFLAVAGVTLAAIAGLWASVVALVLLGLVLSYDWGRGCLGRSISILNMGACRGTSFLLGAAVALPPAEWSLILVMAAVGIMLYITAVSWIAADELKDSFLSKYVGVMIRFLIVVQAVLCALGGNGGVWVGGVVLLGWPLSWWLGKRFYAS